MGAFIFCRIAKFAQAEAFGRLLLIGIMDSTTFECSLSNIGAAFVCKCVIKAYTSGLSVKRGANGTYNLDEFNV
jgi:hypothetical protein